MPSEPVAPVWQPGLAAPILAGDTAYVWRVDLDVSGALGTRLETTLSGDERERAARLRSPTDRARFIAARGALRAILARYLKATPAALRFTYGSHGKPALDAAFGDTDLCFNLAHSGPLALLAVARECAVGIDLERARPDRDDMAIADRFFAAGEAAKLRTLSEDERPAAFLRCWTRKEAYIKARGDGFALPLDSFEVTLAPGDGPALLRARHGPDDAARWSLYDLPVTPGYTAALAVEGASARLELYDADL